MSAPLDSRPWTQVEAWEGGVIREVTKKRLTGHWLGAVIWNLLSLPILVAISVDPQGWADLPLVARSLYLLWAGFGLYLLYRAVVATTRARRFGHVELVLDPFPGSLGGHVGGALEIPVRRNADVDARVKLSCIHSHVRGTGDDRERKEEVLWSQELVPEVERSIMGPRLHFVFDVPDGDLPQSETWVEGGSAERRYWTVHVQARLAGADLDKVFEVPVYRVDPPLHAFRPFEPPEVDLLELADSGVVARHTPDGVEIDYLRGRWGGMGWGVGVAGLVFAGIAWMTWYLPRSQGLATFTILFSSLFVLLFGLVAVALLFSGAHMMLSRRALRVEHGTLTVGSWWFLVPSEEELELSETARIEGVVRSSAGAGTERVPNYTFYAIPYEGEKVLIGDGIRGTYLANRIATVLDEATGVEVTLQ